MKYLKTHKEEKETTVITFNQWLKKYPKNITTKFSHIKYMGKINIEDYGVDSKKYNL